MKARTHDTLDAAEYDRRRRGHHERRRVELLTREFASHPNGEFVIELGCGTGNLLNQVAADHPATRFLGIDVDSRLIAFATQTYSRGQLSFECRDIVADPLDADANVLFSVDVIHHILSVEGMYPAIRRLLSRGGRWIAIEPNILHPIVTLQQERMKRAGLGEDHFNPRREAPRIRAAGFSLERRSYFLALPQCTTVNNALQRVERILERVPLLGGSVVHVYRAM